MNIWIITNARLPRSGPWRASVLQNLQTALALAAQGHRVLLWVAQAEGPVWALAERRLGQYAPPGLRLMRFHPRGPREEKKTPFGGPLQREWLLTRARLAGGTPDAIVTRSPRVLTQLRASHVLPRTTRLVLEYQYPEWTLLWRSWHRRNPAAPLADALDRLRHWQRLEAKGLAAADGVLYAAPAHRPLMGRLGYQGPAGRLPSGAPVPAEAPPEAPPEFDFGYIGTLAPENGIETLLAALARVTPERLLLLLGGGEAAYVQQLRDTCLRLNLEDRVIFGGRVEFVKVRGWMRRCAVGVVPVSARCGCEKRQFASPLKLVEWLAAGVPVVATAVPSIVQHVADGREALLVPPDRPDVLAAALVRLRGDAPLRARLAQAGLAYAADHAHPARARRIVEFLAALQEEPPPGG